MKGPPSSQGVASVPSGGEDGGDSAAKSLAALSDSLDKHGGSGSSFKILLLVLMVLQNSATVLVGRYTRASVAKDDLYSVNHLIVITELGKLLLSAALELQTSRGRLVESIRLHNLERPLDAAKIVVPALLYLVQNTLLYVALSNLTAPIFQVTYQCKLVTTALVSVVMLQRSYSLQQWTCLVVLSVGVAIVVLDNDSKQSGSSTSKTEQSLFVGLVAVSIACMSSALAGVYFEKVLKKPDKEVATQASLWMRNMQLAFFSVVIALGQSVYEGKKDDVAKSYFHGFTFWVWVLVGLQAGGGLLVAAVIKVRAAKEIFS
jgi:UDP-sugar transporter A1/2/3